MDRMVMVCICLVTPHAGHVARKTGISGIEGLGVDAGEVLTDGGLGGGGGGGGDPPPPLPVSHPRQSERSTKITRRTPISPSTIHNVSFEE
jgi:hypothetical protein